MAKKINFGCGKSGKIRWPDYIGIDKQNLGQDIVDTALNIKKYVKDGGVEACVSNMFLEHLTDEEVVRHLNDVWDILQDGGTYYIEVPGVQREKAYSINHKSYWTKAKFEELQNEETASECGLKPFKILECFYNQKGNVYCRLQKVRSYAIKRREGLE